MGTARALGASWLVVLAVAGSANAQPGVSPPPNAWLPPPLGSAPRARDDAGRSASASATSPRPRLATKPVTATAVIRGPAVPVVAKKEYPRALARRALLLPLGVVQATAMFALETVRLDSETRNRGFIDPRVRIGIGAGELELAGSFLAYKPPSMTRGDGAPERFLTALAALKIKILPNTAIGGELAVRNPVADARIYAPRVVAATKLRPSTESAVEGALKAGLDVIAEGESVLVLSGELRGQAQLTDEIAIEARGLLAYNRPNEELAETAMAARSFTQTFGVRIVAGISHELDVIAGFDLTVARDRDPVNLFSLGFAARRLP